MNARRGAELRGCQRVRVEAPAASSQLGDLAEPRLTHEVGFRRTLRGNARVRCPQMWMALWTQSTQAPR